MLRNPSTRPQTYTLDIGEALELPDRAAAATSSWSATASTPTSSSSRARPTTLTLKPFEVLLFEASVTNEELTESVEPPADESCGGQVCAYRAVHAAGSAQGPQRSRWDDVLADRAVTHGHLGDGGAD